MSENIPKSVGKGTIKLEDREITVHVLDDGRRIIEKDDMDHILNELLKYDKK